MRAEFEMMAQLVRQGLPRLATPIERRIAARERLKRSVEQHDARLQIGSVAAPVERHAFAERVDAAVHGVWDGLGTHFDIGDAARELRGDFVLQTIDQGPKFFERQPANFWVRYSTSLPVDTRSCLS